MFFHSRIFRGKVFVKSFFIPEKQYNNIGIIGFVFRAGPFRFITAGTRHITFFLCKNSTSAEEPHKGEQMDLDEVNKIMAKIETELTGDPDQDMDILNEWGERYRGDPDAEPLLLEIGKRLFRLAMDEEGSLPDEIYQDMVETADEDYEEACELIRKHQYEEALSKLLVLSEVIRIYPLPEGTIWMDFDSYLDALNFQDYYADSIGDREIGRHPMHPAKMLFTAGSLLIEMDRAEEAVGILERLLELDPVCPRYLFELGEAYKRTGQIKEAAENALYSLSCAATRVDLARGYRDLAYCLSETGAYEDAVMLYLLSLRYEASRQAQSELAWIRKKAGISADGYNDASILQRCGELGIPVDISETVKGNIEFLKTMPGEE